VAFVCKVPSPKPIPPSLIFSDVDQEEGNKIFHLLSFFQGGWGGGTLQMIAVDICPGSALNN
jgi:hypothetical protein